MPLHAAKIIGLVPVRNEELLIEQCLRSLAVYTDAIVVLDDASEDRTLEIVRKLASECNIEKIITKKKWRYSCNGKNTERPESDDRNALLDAGRKLGGTHFIVLDADELLTANCAHNNLLRNEILKLQPGDSMILHWISLSKSIHTFRAQKLEFKEFIFCDNGTARYYPGALHVWRAPGGLNKSQIHIDYTRYGVLHFKAVNWRNMKLRQAWYQCLERILYPHKTPYEISDYYTKRTQTHDVRLHQCPQEWFDYDFFDKDVYYKPDTWRKQQVEKWIQQYGKEYFKDLNIWDIDWQLDANPKKRRQNKNRKR